MLFKNFLRIIKDYRFSIFQIIFYELLYILRGYKGNNFNLSKNKVMSDDIPTPYYFLENIRKHLATLNFNNFIDLGCGSGRVIYFISRSLKTINFFGIEYFDDQYNSAKKLFKNHKNIKIIKKDFTKINFLKFKIDCFFFNNPFRSEKIFINFVNNLIKKIKVKRRIIFIFVNFKPASLLKIRKIKQISRFYVSSNKGFSIFYLN